MANVADETVSFSLEINVEKAYENIRKLETVLYRSMGLLQQLTGSPEIDRALAQIQSVIVALNQLRLVIAQLQAVSGPIGWAMLLTSLATTAFTYSDVVNEIGSHG